jgi:hypothetical protein
MHWTEVAAFIGPLIAAMAALGALMAYLGRRREILIRAIVKDAFVALDARLILVETALSNQTRHLEQQDNALAQALQSIARIEGRLAERARD